VHHFVLPVMKRNGPVVAWIVDDTGFVMMQKLVHVLHIIRGQARRHGLDAFAIAGKQ